MANPVPEERREWVPIPFGTPVNIENYGEGSLLFLSCGRRRFNKDENMQVVPKILEGQPNILILMHALRFPHERDFDGYETRSSGSTVVFLRTNNGLSRSSFGPVRYYEGPGNGGRCNENLELFAVTICLDTETEMKTHRVVTLYHKARITKKEDDELQTADTHCVERIRSQLRFALDDPDVDPHTPTHVFTDHHLRNQNMAVGVFTAHPAAEQIRFINVFPANFAFSVIDNDATSRKGYVFSSHNNTIVFRQPPILVPFAEGSISGPLVLVANLLPWKVLENFGGMRNALPSVLQTPNFE